LNKKENKKDWVLIGKIVGVYGVKGTIRIQSYAELFEIFKPDTALLVISPEDIKARYKIGWIKSHARGALLVLREISSHDQAKALIGSKLYVESARFPKLEKGNYYWFELIGLNVYTSDDRYLGCVEFIIETGANDVYVVKKNNLEILIPALKSVVKSIDIEQKIMRVELPEGLEEV
jgi:16S rRNA processing protein RimM